MLDHLGSLWSWLTSDVDSSEALSAVVAVEDSLTVAERTSVALLRFVFAAIELLLFFAGFALIPVMLFFFAEVIGISVGAAIFAGVALPLLTWFFTRKPIGLVRSSLLRVFVRRARRRTSLVLDSASASAAPVAVSVDVDHAEPARK